MKGKVSHLSFNQQEKRASQIGIVHSDLCDPMENASIGGSKYFLILNDHTRKVFVYFLKSKDQVADCFEEFQAQVENETGRRIKKLRTNNGREYVNQNLEKDVKKFCNQTSATIPYSPQLNGLAKRMNRTLVEKAQFMLIESNLPKCYWAETVSTAAYLTNRSPTKGFKNIILEEAWIGKKPDLVHLRVFGCDGIYFQREASKMGFESQKIYLRRILC